MPMPIVWQCALVATGLAFVAALTVMVAIVHGRDGRIRAAREALRASEERLRLALEATTEIVWDWDLRTDRMYQARFAQVYGHPEAATPRTFAEFLPYLHPEDLAAARPSIEAAIRGDRDDLEFEHRVRTGSGEWLWMLGRARVVERGADGKARRMVGTCADVTERRRMLERLQLADRMVSVGTLAAGVAHEINNPVAFVSANVGFAVETLEQVLRPGVEQAELVRAAEDCRIALREAAAGAERVRRIVRDLRLLSRSSEDPVVPVDVGRALDAALRLARTELCRRARVTTDLAEVPPVLGDEARISQVFLNLLVNAGQAIPEGRPDDHAVEIRLGLEGGRVALRVRDTGCGIAPENRRRIFDPFFTTKPAGVGTGLGLAISHRIVVAFGGDIEVESAPGQGSTFRVSFPVAAPAGRPAPAGAPAAFDGAAPRESPAGARVLVAPAAG